MTPGVIFSAATSRFAITKEIARAARRAPALSWLGHPMAYTVCVPIVALLGVGSTLAAAWFLGPEQFGAFTLLSTLFLYAAKADLGLSQLADRELTLAAVDNPAIGGNLLRARWVIGVVGTTVAVPVAAALTQIDNKLQFFDCLIAIMGGAGFMIANGRVTIHRATRRVWEFTVTALLLQIGLTAPRIAGLAIGGVTGCFAVMAVWYASLALALSRPTALLNAQDFRMGQMLGAAVPMFAFDCSWTLYLSANRWISAALSPTQFGLYAFAANLGFIALGLLATIAQVRYPKLLAYVSKDGLAAASPLIEREMLGMAGLLASAALGSIFLARPSLRLIFPHYVDATPAAVATAIACVPLGIVAWILPIGIVFSKRPWRDAFTTFVPMLIVLLAAMLIGDFIGGITGQAWGTAIAALALAGTLTSLLLRLHLLERRSAIRVMMVIAGLVLGLTTVAFANEPGRLTIVYDASQPVEALPPPGWKLAFDDEFDRLQLWSPGRGGVWEPFYPWGGRTNPNSHELQYYVDPRPNGDKNDISRLAPYAIENGILNIRAQPIPVAHIKLAQGLTYVSGLLSTARTFSCTYCYVAMRARVPHGKGLWPALWLIPVDRSWPPEIDVMEVLGRDTRAYYATVHSTAIGDRTDIMTKVIGPDLADGFHEYAMKWSPLDIVWYLDGRRVASVKTPPDLTKPMYIVVNLAVGGWAEAPDPDTQFPATLQVDWIRAYVPPASREGIRSDGTKTPTH